MNPLRTAWSLVASPRRCLWRFGRLPGTSCHVTAVFLLVVLILTGCRPSASAPEAAASQTQHSAEEEAPELAAYMSDLQRWAHKAALSVEAQNGPLAEFYLHELEETVEAVQEGVPTYEGHAIGPLTEQILVPSLEALDAAVDAGDWPLAAERLRGVAQSCNTCHDATGHGFVRIQLGDVANPYAQSFEPQAPPDAPQ